MAEKSSRIRVQQQEQVTHVQFAERNILDEASIQQIGEEISRIIEAQPNPRILLDFTAVEHLSSAALGTLITINNKIRRQGGQLRLSNIDPQIYEVFVITKLNTLFQIHDQADQAVQSFT